MGDETVSQPMIRAANPAILRMSHKGEGGYTFRHRLMQDHFADK
jgi:hypothetical protein